MLRSRHLFFSASSAKAFHPSPCDRWSNFLLERYCFLLLLFASEHLFPRCVCELNMIQCNHFRYMYMHVQIVHCHTFPAYKTAQMADRRSGAHTHSLPTRPHRWQIAGQGHTHIPCLQDRTDGRLPVRDTHTHTHSLPTRPHRWQIAGQGHTHTHIPCLQDRTDGRSPVRDTHTHTHSLPTRPHRWQIAGQGHTHTYIPCLQDRTDGRSPVREST